MKILVTGGAGFIGSHVVDKLHAAGHALTVVDDLSAGDRSRVPVGVDLIVHDLADAATVDLVGTLEPDAIIHAAAQVSVVRSSLDPSADARSNIIGSIRLFEGARRHGVRRVVYVTTGGALYGDADVVPTDEEQPIRPLSPYGLSKWVAERYLALLASNQRRVVLRLANVYGPRQDADGEAGVVAIFAKRMLAGLPVEIHGDGEQTRDFVFVEDAARAAVLALTTDEDLTVNIGSGRATSIGELFQTIRQLVGSAHDPDHAPPRPGDMVHSVLDVRLANRRLGWTSETGLDAGLRRTIDWYRANGSQPPDADASAVGADLVRTGRRHVELRGRRCGRWLTDRPEEQ